MQRTTYQEAGIAGKFRMLHIAHKELVLRAIGLCEHVHVFIVDLPSYKRYTTIEELQSAFRAIFASVGFTAYSLHVITEDLSGEAWDRRVLELAPNINAMFDSKELYDNILVENAFIPLKSSLDISVSAIEQYPYEAYNASLIAREFWPYMVQHIYIIGKAGTGVTMLAQKLASFYQTVYSCDNNTPNEYPSTAIRYQFYAHKVPKHISKKANDFIITIGEPEVERLSTDAYDQLVKNEQLQVVAEHLSYEVLFLEVIDIIETRYNAK